MINIAVKKIILFIIFGGAGLFTSTVFGQCCTMSVTISDQDGQSSTIRSTDFGDDTYYEQQRQNRANNMNRYENYQIEVSRFNQKLVISANAVHNMDATKTQASKYPYALALYQKSMEAYKKLEAISAAAAQNVKLSKDISAFQGQQDKIVNEAVDNYHKGQYVQELGDNQAQIIEDAKTAFILNNCLSKEEKSELKVLEVQIKDIQTQIAQLHNGGQPMENIRDQLNNDYHTLALATKSLAKTFEEALKVYAPNEVVKPINVTEKVLETFIDEAANTGKPSEAVQKAFEEGYKEYKKEEQDQKKTPSEKKIEMMKQVVRQAQKEYADYRQSEQNRAETMKAINESIDFTNDLIQRNQRLLNAAAAKGNKLTQRCFDEYYKRRLN